VRGVKKLNGHDDRISTTGGRFLCFKPGVRLTSRHDIDHARGPGGDGRVEAQENSCGSVGALMQSVRPELLTIMPGLETGTLRMKLLWNKATWGRKGSRKGGGRL